MKPENNKEEVEQNAVVKGMSHILADTYTLYLRTQNYHWNVKGSTFQQLHLLFEGQYQELAIAVDEIAERIRSLGQRPPATFKEFVELSSIKENVEEMDSKQMILALIEGNETISRKAKEVSLIAREYNDEVSSGMLVNRVKNHEKAIWILESLNG